MVYPSLPPKEVTLQSRAQTAVAAPARTDEGKPPFAYLPSTILKSRRPGYADVYNPEWSIAICHVLILYKLFLYMVLLLITLNRVPGSMPAYQGISATHFQATFLAALLLSMIAAWW